jgi:hypothetical protein
MKFIAFLVRLGYDTSKSLDALNFTQATFLMVTIHSFCLVPHFSQLDFFITYPCHKLSQALYHRENSIWVATKLIVLLIDNKYSCFANFDLYVHHNRGNHMTFVKAVLEVLQLASLYEPISSIWCKSELHLISYSVNLLYSSSSSIFY